jgi:hypothetical protein
VDSHPRHTVSLYDWSSAFSGEQIRCNGLDGKRSRKTESLPYCRLGHRYTTLQRTTFFPSYLNAHCTKFVLKQRVLYTRYSKAARTLNVNAEPPRLDILAVPPKLRIRSLHHIRTTSGTLRTANVCAD